MTRSGTANRINTTSLAPPSTPRLRTEPAGSPRTLLDGGWWPRSTDPFAELPGLILAIDTLHGPVTRVVLAADGWDSHPRRLGVNGRVLRLGYFSSQPTCLITALCANGDRIDLLVIPPNTATGTADARMILAATASNLLHTARSSNILSTVSTSAPHPAERAAKPCGAPKAASQAVRPGSDP
jgi:Family of unknown function (DUF5994)